jgi:SAM-dependent methyltransferase
VEKYHASAYGDSFAGHDFEALHRHLPDPTPMVDMLAALAMVERALEFGVGTGRVARPLAERGTFVDGIDASSVLLGQLRARAGRLPIEAWHADFTQPLPLSRQYRLVYCVWNTLFSATTSDALDTAFGNAARALHSGGVLVIEAFVPSDRSAGDGLRVRHLDAGSVTLQINRHHPERQQVESQHIHVSAAGIRLHPQLLRYADPGELDERAGRAGLTLSQRWADWHRSEFGPGSAEHVSLYVMAGNAAAASAS